MLPFPVTEHRDVFEGGRVHLGASNVANTMHSLVLQTIEPTRRRRAIPAVAFAGHQANHAVGREFVPEGLTGVLACPIGVVHQIWCRLLSEPGHGQTIGQDIRRHARLQRPTRNLAVEQVEDDGAVQPVFIRPQVRDIRRCDRIRRRQREVSGGQIPRHQQAMLRVCRDLVTPLVPGVNATLPHQSFNPFIAGRENKNDRTTTIWLWSAFSGGKSSDFGCRGRSQHFRTRTLWLYKCPNAPHEIAISRNDLYPCDYVLLAGSAANLSRASLGII